MDKLKAYEQLKKDLENGEITQKGFDNNIKKLLTAEKSDDTTSTRGNEFLSAAEAFGKAKKLLQPQVKKRQFPLNDKRLDHAKSLLKVRLAPMEWKPRTHRKCGRYQKLIMDEAPPRIILQGHETYDDLITIGKERFWPERTEGSEFTLCHSDGTRWSKQEFHKEYGTVSDITHMWKRTIYIGRRQLGNKVFNITINYCLALEFVWYEIILLFVQRSCVWMIKVPSQMNFLKPS
ncbi:uncharacterized protein LOC143414328 isoform X2 [Maylandia zebra]|uniref:uncharacterized protein LOC143414328 isoform X2 n=1 Tax=Maylandia zebra TaxID=106582 RepID=UPI00403C5E17